MESVEFHMNFLG